MMVKQYEYPPRVLVIPVVECREWAEGEMPEEGKTRVLALDESYHTARVAIYRDTGRVITG